MKWIHFLCTFAACIGFSPVQALQCSNELPVRLGEWNANFAEAKQIADEQHIPMVLFWGGASCGICRTVESALEASDVVAWQKSRNLVFVFQSGTDGEMKKLTSNASGTYPYICVYWNRGDGTTSTNRFSGVVSGSSRWPVTGTTIGEHFIKSVESFLGDFQPADYYSGKFVCDGTPGNRLEAVLGKATRLQVPLKRDKASSLSASTNWLVAAYPSGTELPESTNFVTWVQGEDDKLVAIELPPPTAPLRPSDIITLTLINAGGLVADQSTAQFVKEPENAPSNPDWLGEPFAFGRWTFDRAAATEAVNRCRQAGKKAATLVLFTGALWCPYCKGIETSLLKPGSRFYDWARANNVALVEFDQGRASSPATAAGTRAPRLLTYETNARDSVTGAGYLSRHEVDRADAEAVIAETTRLTHDWLAPESTAARLSQPTILLVEGDRVIGRFAAYRNADRTYDEDENLARLNDFLKLLEGTDETVSYRTTTTNVFGVGDSARATLQISRREVYYQMPEVSPGVLTVMRRDAGLEDVFFTLMQGGRTVAQGTNGLNAALSRAEAQAGGFFLRASAYADASAKLFDGSDGVVRTTTCFDAVFSASTVLVPEEGSAVFRPKAGEVVRLAVSQGVAYRLQGLSEETLRQHFTVDADGLWTARETGTFDFPVAEGVGEVSYQIWRPGEVAFVDPEPAEIDEADRVLVMSVVRTNGVSCAARVRVLADADAVAARRFELGMVDADGVFSARPPELTWADGEEGERSFAVRIIDDWVCDGNQAFTLQLETTEGSMAVSPSSGAKRVTILENDLRGAGRLAITDVQPGFARGRMLVVPAGSSVTFEVTRLDAADGEVGARFEVTVDGETRDGLIDPSTLTWADKCRGEEAVKRVSFTLPEDLVGSQVSVKMTAQGEGIKLDLPRSSMTVQVIASASPQFVERTSSWTGLAQVALHRDVALSNFEGDSRTIKVYKRSGSLPPGVKATFDTTAQTLVFSGRPTRAGAFVATYQVCATQNGRIVQGGTFTATMTIGALAEAFPVFADATWSARTVKDLFFVEDESKRVAGLLTLTLPANGRLSAKYRCSAGTVAFSTTGWDKWNPETGELSAFLTSRKAAFADYWVEVTLNTAGGVFVRVHDVRYPAAYLERTVDLTRMPGWATPWKGLYTLAFPVRRYQAASDSDVAYAAAAAGSPCFTLRMTSRSALNVGRMTYVGWLPNGRGVSGSALVTQGDDLAQLPIFFRGGTDLFAAAVGIERDANEKYRQDAGGPFKFGLRTVKALPRIENWWEHFDARDAGLDFGWTYDAYGSFYVEEENLAECLEKSGVATDVMLAADMTTAPTSLVHGASTEKLEVPVAATADGLVLSPEAEEARIRLRLNRRTGVLTGTLRLPFENGDVHAPLRGVVLPGWTGCGCHDEDVDLPLFLGSTWFNDKVTYTNLSTKVIKTLSVKRGCSISGETHIDLGK